MEKRIQNGDVAKEKRGMSSKSYSKKSEKLSASYNKVYAKANKAIVSGDRKSADKYYNKGMKIQEKARKLDAKYYKK